MRPNSIPALLALTFSGISSALPALTPRQGNTDWYFTLYDDPTCDMSSYQWYEGFGSSDCVSVLYTGLYYAKQVVVPECTVNFYDDDDCTVFKTALDADLPPSGTCEPLGTWLGSYNVVCDGD